MKKILFANGSELEISNISQAGNELSIVIENAAVDDVISIFKNNTGNTAVMRYYVGIDLIRGYAGYTKLAGIEYTPDVVQDIDYNTIDPSTESGFAEIKTDICTVHMEKVTGSNTAITEKMAAHDSEISVLKSDMGALEKTILGEEA